MIIVIYHFLQSYVLGEIPSLKDRITLVRQLWDLTGDILVSFTTLYSVSPYVLKLNGSLRRLVSLRISCIP